MAAALVVTLSVQGSYSVIYHVERHWQNAAIAAGDFD